MVAVTGIAIAKTLNVSLFGTRDSRDAKRLQTVEAAYNRAVGGDKGAILELRCYAGEAASKANVSDATLKQCMGINYLYAAGMPEPAKTAAKTALEYLQQAGLYGVAPGVNVAAGIPQAVGNTPTIAQMGLPGAGVAVASQTDGRNSGVTGPNGSNIALAGAAALALFFLLGD